MFVLAMLIAGVTCYVMQHLQSVIRLQVESLALGRNDMKCLTDSDV